MDRKSLLVNACVEALITDVSVGDVDSIKNLVERVPVKHLENYLSEEELEEITKEKGSGTNFQMP